MSRSDRVPLKPDYAAAARRRTGTPLVRAAAASAEAYIRKTLAKDVLAQRWPRDGDIELILRAAVAPAALTTSSRADSSAATSVADFIATMGPTSAGSQLLQRRLQLRFNGAAANSVPGLLSAAGQKAEEVSKEIGVMPASFLSAIRGLLGRRLDLRQRKSGDVYFADDDQSPPARLHRLTQDFLRRTQLRLPQPEWSDLDRIASGTFKLPPRCPSTDGQS